MALNQEVKKIMKRIEYSRYGGPEVMRLADSNVAEPRKGEVLVRVAAASINPWDWKRRGGYLQLFFNRKFPKAMGSDFAGIVEKVGDGVSRFREGDEVVGSTPKKSGGAFAEKVITSDGLLTHKPKTLTFEQASVLPIPVTTAWMMITKSKPKRGSSIFINGSSGAVGLSAIALLRPLGVEITGRCAPSDIDNGIKAGLINAISYRDPIPDHLAHRFDIVFDASGTLTQAETRSLMKAGGKAVDVVTLISKVWRAILFPSHIMLAFNGDIKYLEPAIQAALQTKLYLPIGRIVPISDAISLIEDLELGKAPKGKGVIGFGP